MLLLFDLGFFPQGVILFLDITTALLFLPFVEAYDFLSVWQARRGACAAPAAWRKRRKSCTAKAAGLRPLLQPKVSVVEDWEPTTKGAWT